MKVPKAIDMAIPDQIKKAAKAELKITSGGKLVYLGKYEGADVYKVSVNYFSDTGYPTLYLLKNGIVSKVYGPDSIIILISLSGKTLGISE